MTLPGEPRLSPDDVACWDRWRISFTLRTRTREFRSRLDAARRIVDRELARSSAAMVGWSAGKDSTALAHLVTVDRGHRGAVLVSEKDDLDYPGEEDYVSSLAETWGASLRIVRPATSPTEWIAARAHRMSAGEDLHSRRSGIGAGRPRDPWRRRRLYHAERRGAATDARAARAHAPRGCARAR